MTALPESPAKSSLYDHAKGGAPEHGWCQHPSFEQFRVKRNTFERVVRRSDGTQSTSVMGACRTYTQGPVSADEAEAAWLRSSLPPNSSSGRAEIRAVDLFAGCGGLSIGVAEAARALGMSFEPVLAVDVDQTATQVYAANFPTAATMCRDITELLTGDIGTRLTADERKISKRCSDVSIMVGGPPCQGHSDFNNRTRHRDAKNELYRTMVRAAEVIEPQHILIENVPGALNDRRSVVQRTADALDELGYNVALAVVDLSEIGVPQRRRRLILMASQTSSISPAQVLSRHRRDMRSIRWAIEDLQSLTEAQRSTPLDAVARSAPATQRRIDYLFESNLFDLPDSERPACHAKGGHSYRSIYGRLRWDEPSQTITTGFYSMCMGRYVHPNQRRTLTAHEAARLQYIPDWFDFSTVRHRTALARMIGNAVPSRLSYAVAFEWFR